MPPSQPVKKTSYVARTPLAALGEYDCRLDHRGRGPEDITRVHVVNVHRRGTYVKHVEGREVFVEPGRVVFFQRGQVYRTSHPHGFGDAGAWISVREDWLAEIGASIDASAADRPERPFRADHLAPDARVALAVELLFARAPSLEPYELEESVATLAVELVRRAARAPFASRRPDRRRSEIAAALRARLSRRLGERTDLSSLASDLGASPFALCRAFRAETGVTMSAWRRRVRLGGALERVLGSGEELLPIALDLGFASHSHLTREFRAAFGVTPSALRERVRSRAPLAREIAAALAAR